MNGLFWLASSERERQQALELARALKQSETLDDLGIGSVRDRIAERLFPGTSTLHTRARYHLFIPWTFRQAAHRPTTDAIVRRVRDLEVATIAALRESDDTGGVIGIDSGAALKTMPSALYWRGTHAWGLRRVAGPRSAVIATLQQQERASVRDDDGLALDQVAGELWHRSLPPAPESFPLGASFALTRNEAEFLAERLETEPATAGSMLAQLVRLDVNHLDVKAAWDHPHLGQLSEATREIVEQGRRFAALVQGASWLYNVSLAKKAGRAELEQEHRESFEGWATTVGSSLDDWDLERLWKAAGPGVPDATRGFVRAWLGLIRTRGAAQLLDDQAARDLIVRREQAVKKANARTLNSKALQQWNGSSGTASLDYRWLTARRLLDDIRHGLEADDAQD